jgi:hypothetical protein
MADDPAGTDEVDKRFVAATACLKTLGLIEEGSIVKGSKTWKKAFVP